MARPTTAADDNLGQRVIPPNPFDSWWLTLPSKITPQYALNIIRAAQGGDLWQQWQLHALMLDQWPMYKKCVHELCEAVSNLKFKVSPFCEEGKEPSKSAKEKADFARRCLFGLRPNPFNDEKDLKATAYHQAQAFAMGMQLSEIIWNEPRRAKGGFERTPKATAFVHPRHFTYTADGYLVVYDEEYNRLRFDWKNGQAQPDPDRFICGQFFSHAGNSLGSGFMRSLTWWFAALVYNREWSLLFAQKHGAPFMDATYKPGTPDAELQALKNFLANGAADGYVLHVEGSTVNVHSPQAAGADNPQRRLQEEADRQCQLLILGQTLTSDLPSGKGSYAASQTHLEVRQDRIESVGRWVAENPFQQLVRAIMRVNFKTDEDECPIVEADFTKPLSIAEKAQLITAISNSRIPFNAEQFYRLIDMPMPEEGDKVIVGGMMGELGSTEEEVSAIGNPGVAQIEGQLETEALARRRGLVPAKASELRLALTRASDGELENLRDLLVRAKEAAARGHVNGEQKDFESAVANLAAKHSRFSTKGTI